MPFDKLSEILSKSRMAVYPGLAILGFVLIMWTLYTVDPEFITWLLSLVGINPPVIAPAPG